MPPSPFSQTALRVGPDRRDLCPDPGQWRYLYRAIDKHGEPVDFLLTADRDLDAAKRFFRKMLKEAPLLSPDRIGTDGRAPIRPAPRRRGKTVSWRATPSITSPSIFNNGSRATTSG